MRLAMMPLAIVLLMTTGLRAAESSKALEIEAPNDWKGEKISLPPSFAPDMQLVGTESIRFAPGMFEADSESFFSYVFVFELAAKPELTQKALQREFLVYYRGLAEAVSKSRGVTVKAADFSFELKPADKADDKDSPRASGRKRYAGELEWIEPFATQKSQSLHLEIDTWNSAATKRSYLFAAVSPQKKTAAIWTTMRKLRTAYHLANKSGDSTTASSTPSRSYSIPTLDLSGQTHRQVVVDREQGQYLGHPTTVLLEDNKTMIVVYPKGHGRGAIVMKRSNDAGLTWSDRLPTPDSWATSREVPTIHRVVDPAGKKRLIMFSGLYPIRMAVSDDDGGHWSELDPIGRFGGIVTMGCVVELKTDAGHYMALFHDDGRFLRGGPKTIHGSPAGTASKFFVYKTLSHDGGLTWGEPDVIATHPTAHLCEPGEIRSPDGKQLAVLLRENARKHNSFVIFSNDEGRTWSEPRELPASLTGDRHTGRYAPDGRLFISFRDTTLVSPTKGDWVAWVGEYDDIVAGGEGQYRVRLMDNHKGADCAYPAVDILPDGTLVTTTYGHWVKDEKPYIVSVRLKLEELDELASTQKK